MYYIIRICIPQHWAKKDVDPIPVVADALILYKYYCSPALGGERRGSNQFGNEPVRSQIVASLSFISNWLASKICKIWDSDVFWPQFLVSNPAQSSVRHVVSTVDLICCTNNVYGVKYIGLVSLTPHCMYRPRPVPFALT